MKLAQIAGAAAGISTVTVLLLACAPHAHASVNQAPYHTATCQYDNPTAKVLCVNQAPRKVCREVFGEATCWWFTGTNTQVLFDRHGRVTTS